MIPLHDDSKVTLHCGDLRKRMMNVSHAQNMSSCIVGAVTRQWLRVIVIIECVSGLLSQWSATGCAALDVSRVQSCLCCLRGGILAVLDRHFLFLAITSLLLISSSKSYTLARNSLCESTGMALRLYQCPLLFLQPHRLAIIDVYYSFAQITRVEGHFRIIVEWDHHIKIICWSYMLFLHDTDHI